MLLVLTLALLYPIEAKPESPMSGNLSAVVLSDNDIGLEFIITSSIDAPNTSAEILLPESFSLLNGNVKWSGDITAGETIRLQAVVRTTEEGNFTILAVAKSVRTSYIFGATDSVHIWIEEGKLTLSKTLPPPSLPPMNERVGITITNSTIQEQTQEYSPMVDNPFAVSIISPTQSNPVNVGTYNNPNHINVVVEVKEDNNPVTELTNDNFTFKIDDKEAIFNLMDTSIPGRYVFDVSPPQQESPGCYDLEVILKYKGIEITDTEKEAVCHTKGYADVMLIIDRSGSMCGEIADVRNSENDKINKK